MPKRKPVIVEGPNVFHILRPQHGGTAFDVVKSRLRLAGVTGVVSGPSHLVGHYSINVPAKFVDKARNIIILERNQ